MACAPSTRLHVGKCPGSEGLFSFEEKCGAKQQPGSTGGRNTSNGRIVPDFVGDASRSSLDEARREVDDPKQATPGLCRGDSPTVTASKAPLPAPCLEAPTSRNRGSEHRENPEHQNPRAQETRRTQNHACATSRSWRPPATRQRTCLPRSGPGAACCANVSLLGSSATLPPL